MKMFFLSVVVLLSVCFSASAQNALILNDAVVINITGGAVLNIDQSNASGIVVNGTGAGYIQSEGESNRVAWHINSGTGDHVIPFGVGGTKIDMHYNVTSAGSASGTLIASTYATSVANTPYPNVYAPVVTNMDSTGYVGTNDHSLYTADRFWILRDTDRPWATKPSSTITLTYRDAEYASGNTITETDLLAQFWDNSQWNPGWYTGSARLGVNNAASNQVNSINAGTNGNLYTWILAAKDHPLPIELAELKANCSSDAKPVVEWVTVSETNNAYFSLFRSNEGTDWSLVTTISGAGNSNTPLYYSFTDNCVSEGALYYKLVQTDFDGNESDEGIVQINCYNQMKGGSYDMNIYSDENHQVHVTFNSEVSEKIVFNLFDIRGRLIYQEKVTTEEGLNHFVLDFVPVSEASYLFNMTGSMTNESRKFFMR
jgi:hypothetical protein